MGHLDKLLAPTLEYLGYDIVRVSLQGAGRTTLQVMAERQDGAPMTVADCETISRSLSALLDVEDPIPGTYDLEVSSPGLDRPLVRRRDYERFAGREARIETDRLINGQRRFRGVIEGIDEADMVAIRVPDAPEDQDPVRLVPFGAIIKAKLLMTDALIEEALRASKQAAADAGDVEGGEIEFDELELEDGDCDDTEFGDTDPDATDEDGDGDNDNDATTPAPGR
ncbi:ribosome maturation factor RimP [Phaeovibrio sulfidiphilus]|uniref:Ribosome maturation factor RimP n=1 Tax=Phaeovibrio sulfidiphilus TaxID=1220600 RepID=A0A8J6YM63_9PROT|nr:ribosome maturation factor RimP [Phaeovibrio sulfidiphilus]MBE1236384.1 ribosome maturation factor RimP [Phaeovibrio sulfidiphilus]